MLCFLDDLGILIGLGDQPTLFFASLSKLVFDFAVVSRHFPIALFKMCVHHF
jgi:hypothetical protein